MIGKRIRESETGNAKRQQASLLSKDVANLEEILGRLSRVRKSGKNWSARCPVHNDKNPSLGVTVSKHGTVVLKCFAGCDSSEIDDALQLIPAKSKKGLVQTYDYTDERKTLLYQVCRYEPKRFTIRRPDGTGGYVNSIGTTRRVLYNLPGISAAIKARKTVFFCEGEKDAARLIAEGLCATTIAMGVKAWRSQFAESLRGAAVIILPDNDEPGRSYARQVSTALTGIASSVRIAKLPNLPDKGDVSDWLNAGGDPNVLAKLPSVEFDIDPIVDQLNQRYAYAIVGNREAVIEERRLPNGELTIDVMSIDVFRGWHREHTTLIEGVRGSRKVSVADIWLESKDKRKYRDVEFAPPPLITGPDVYNLFKGFSFEPARGDCSIFLDHIQKNVCQGNREYYRWVMGWFAQLFQEPAKKIGTSLVLRGKQGTGKTKVGEVIGRLMRPYLFVASHPQQVTGHFNAHLKDCLLLLAEEAFFAGAKREEGVLKDLITSPTLRVEFKGRDILTVRNCIRLLVTSNSDWVVPAAIDNRRFTVLDVGEERIQDHSYFAAMDKQLEAGGYSALLFELLHYKYDEALIRKPLDTPALREQQLKSLSPFDIWIIHLLTEGALPGDSQCRGLAHSRMLWEQYQEFSRNRNVRFPLGDMEFANALRHLIPSIVKKKARFEGRSTSAWAFPSLSEARKEVLAQLWIIEPGWQEDQEWGDTGEGDPTAVVLDEPRQEFGQ